MMYAIPKAGESIRVAVESRNTNIFTYKEQPVLRREYEGVVVASDKWDRPNTFNMTGDQHIKVRNIYLGWVVHLEVVGGKTSKVDLPSGFRAFRVKSGSGDKEYVVTVNGGRYECTCVGFQFRRNCRHTKAVAEKVKGSK